MLYDMWDNYTPKPVTYKVVTLGSSGVGKTSLMMSLVHESFKDNMSSTIGTSFMVKKVKIPLEENIKDNHNFEIENSEIENSLKYCEITYEIYDTAGQERYESLAPLYYRDAHIVLIIYDVTNRDSWERAQKWVETIQAQANPILIVIIGNKVDLPNRKVTKAELMNYINHENSEDKNTQNISYLFYETSAKYITNKSLRMYGDNSGRSMTSIFLNISQKVIGTQNITKTNTINLEKIDNSSNIFKGFLSIFSC